MAAGRSPVVVTVALLVCACVLLAHGAPQKIPGASQGVFDKKAARAAAIHDSWIEEGYGFQTITDADYPYGVCMFGKPYEVKFNITIPTDGAFLRVDTQQGYVGVLCNLDHTDIEFHFSSEADAKAFRQSTASGHPILTGAQGKAECTPNNGMFKRVSLVNESVVAVPNSKFGGTTFAVRVRSFRAAYDHIIKSGTVEFGNAAAGSRFANICDQPEGPAHFCIGLNTDKTCTAAAGPIVFYQNEYVTLECSNCWLGFSMDVGLKMRLEDFLLYDSIFRFDNMVVNGALVAHMMAQYHWGVSYDATVPVIGPTDLVQFWLGPVPIVIGFELPLQRVADASFDASAQAEAGAVMQWYLGSYQVLWDPLEGWRADKNEPGLMYKTTVSGEAQFSGSANFGLAPTLTVNLNSFFTTQVEFSAMVHANVQGSTSTKQVCADVNYDVLADGSATLEIAIPWIDVDESWSWSETWFSKSGTIAQACTKSSKLPPAKPKLLLAPSADPPMPPKKNKPIHHQSRPAHLNGPYRPTKTIQGKQSACLNKRGYTLTHNLVMEDSYNLLDLVTFPGFHKMRCNTGGNNFRIDFESDGDKKQFMRQAQPYTTFLTGPKWLSDDCHGLYDTTVFMFRVQNVYDTSIPFIKYQVEVEVSPSRYDEAFLHADLSLNPDDSVRCDAPNVQHLEKDEHICLGVNTDKACSAARKSLVMYKSDQLTVDCTNCFFALQTDVFFELHIEYYWVKSLSGGFKNMTLDAAMVLEIIAQAQWNSGTNITEDAVPPTTILDFAIGPVPVRLWFEIPLRRLAEVQVNVLASVTAGAIAHWSIGDYYVNYAAGQGWTHVAPRPTLAWKPFVADIKAQFTASAVLGLIPTFGFHVDSVFWTTLTLDPEVTLAANGSLASKQVCASAHGRVTATAYAELDFNVPFIYLHLGAWWGPETVYDSGVKPLGSVCKSFLEESEPIKSIAPY